MRLRHRLKHRRAVRATVHDWAERLSWRYKRRTAWYWILWPIVLLTQSPRYGSPRYRLQRWLRQWRPITRRRHELELARVRRDEQTVARRRIEEERVRVDELIAQLIPRLSTAAIHYEQRSGEGGAHRLELWISAQVVHELARYPGDRNFALEHLAERMGYELGRHLKTLDFGLLFARSRVPLWGPPR